MIFRSAYYFLPATSRARALNSRESLFDIPFAGIYIASMSYTFSTPLSVKSEQDETKELRPNFNSDGLIAAIAQDSGTGEVLMLAWMNAEALRKTIDTGIATYWSRSRSALWVKGETSGSTQKVLEIRIDCDQDAVLIIVKPAGGACHTGRQSCFYRAVSDTGDSLLHLTESS